jgi:hypothetical protein
LEGAFDRRNEGGGSDGNGFTNLRFGRMCVSVRTIENELQILVQQEREKRNKDFKQQCCPW